MNSIKKTAIVSCYFQHNYGSMLQAYATQKILDKLGYENETIDISGFRKDIRISKIKYFMKASLTSDILLYKTGMFKNVLRKKLLNDEYSLLSRVRDQKFEEFYKRYFRFSKKYSSIDQLHEECAANYSSVLVGSDQLWLPANIAADYYTLSFVPETVNTIAYATSFGQSVLPGSTAKKAAVFLKKIRHIAVREESGQKLVMELSGRHVPIVCDPTLLFSGDEWLSIQKKAPLVPGEYILCYFLGKNPQHRAFAINLKKLTGCQIIALPHLDEFVKEDEHYADDKLYEADPSDFLNLVRNAKYVCTDSFHCTVFSILYKKNFFTFHRYTKETRQSTNGRLDSLFHILNMEDRLLSGTEQPINYLKKEIDYAAVYKNLAHLQKHSCGYLETALNDKGSTDL